MGAEGNRPIAMAMGEWEQSIAMATGEWEQRVIDPLLRQMYVSQTIVKVLLWCGTTDTFVVDFG